MIWGFEIARVVTINCNHVSTEYNLRLLLLSFFLIFHRIKTNFKNHLPISHIGLVVKSIWVMKRNNKWLYEVLFHILFIFILNNEIVMQSQGPQITLSHFSASLKKALWENPILKSRRLGAVGTNRGLVTFWICFPDCHRRILDTSVE